MKIKVGAREQNKKAIMVLNRLKNKFKILGDNYLISYMTAEKFIEEEINNLN